MLENVLAAYSILFVSFSYFSFPAGVMTGLSVFRLFNYSTSLATFQTEYTSTGDRLMQVSGVRVTYNTQLEGSRLIAIEMMNRETGVYKPLERLNYYKFATDSWNCEGFDPFPALLGSELVVDDEKPGSTGSLLVQTITADFLSQLQDPYDTSIQGRLVNNTSSLDPMNWTQTEDSCKAGTYWNANFLTCFACPVIGNVTFDEEFVEFADVSGSDVHHPGQARLYNNGDSPVSVILESKPPWIEFENDGLKELRTLDPGTPLLINFAASSYYVEAGYAQRTISFGVLDGGNFPGCTGTDATLDVRFRVHPKPKLFKPEEILIVGLSLMSLLIALSLACGGIVKYHREHRVVKALQPEFLQIICLGVCVVALAILPMSLEDEISSQTGRDMACMASPWLLSLGFNIIMSALFVKLRRINTVMNSGFRRTTVTAKEAAIPFCLLFGVNIVVLTLWTFVDPLRWEVREVEDDKSRLYGSCSDIGVGGWVLVALTVLVNVCALILACIEAFKARNISTEYSESKSLGHALFSWTQIIIVGVPLLSLISGDNPSARYFLEVSLIFAACLSMLVLIFGQVFVQLGRRIETPVRASVRISGLSFPSGPGSGFPSSEYFTQKTKESSSHNTSGGSSSLKPAPNSSLVAEPSGCDSDAASSDHHGSSAEIAPSAVDSVISEGPMGWHAKTIPEDAAV
jgi:hypothetical protein